MNNPTKMQFSDTHKSKSYTYNVIQAICVNDEIREFYFYIAKYKSYRIKCKFDLIFQFCISVYIRTSYVFLYILFWSLYNYDVKMCTANELMVICLGGAFIHEYLNVWVSFSCQPSLNI